MVSVVPALHRCYIVYGYIVHNDTLYHDSPHNIAEYGSSVIWTWNYIFIGHLIVVGSQVAISGNLGTEILTFAAGTTFGEVVTAINAISENTGVVAYTNATGFHMRTAELGDDQFLRVEDLDGSGRHGDPGDRGHR